MENKDLENKINLISYSLLDVEVPEITSIAESINNKFDFLLDNFQVPMYNVQQFLQNIGIEETEEKEAEKIEVDTKEDNQKKEEFGTVPKPHKENQQYLGDLGNQPKKGKFEASDKGKTEFFSTMFNTYRKVLKDRGLNPDWAYILTASASIESAYGQKLAAHYNYGGVKVTKEQRAKGVSHQWSMTPDWIRDANGNLYKKRHLQPFRAYSSIEDYCNRVINLLSNKRYQMFQKYSPYDYVNTWYHILDSGYAKSDYKNQMHYAKILGQRVNELKRRLNI